ncbi:MAG: cation transporter [Betaproteobacteria bacterium]|nr:cation transporter [Betaproteobacteria bacterium]
MDTHRSPVFYAWLSVLTSVITIGLKFGAWWLTGSVGLLSDAIESLVNLAAALVALWTLSYVSHGADDDHHFGHEKAEYFSSGIEGGLIFVAAVSIIATAIPGLINPQPLQQLGLGFALSIIAAGANALCGWFLLQGARAHRSITLEADARHLLSDVWTTVGVLVAVLLVPVTGWWRLDPLVAIAVALQILWTGSVLIKRSFDGLMDKSIPVDELARVIAVLETIKSHGGDYHALRTRRAGRKHFVDVHILLPGTMSIQEGHDLVQSLESTIMRELPMVEVLTHLEPLEDVRSWDDPKQPLAGH